MASPYWRRAATPGRSSDRALDGSRVEAVGRAGSTILAATEQGVYESNDEGATWKATLDGVDVRSLAVAIDGTVFAGADKAVLYRRRPADEQFAEVLSFKDLPTYWTWTFPGSPHLPNLRAITVSPTNPQARLRRRRGRGRDG